MPLLPPARWAGLICLLALPAAGLAQAQDAPVYRCGNSYQARPCAGGTAVDVADPRSEQQRREAERLHQREAALAGRMAADRRAAERQAARQGAPANLGPAPETARDARPAKPARPPKQAKPPRGTAPQAAKPPRAERTERPKRRQQPA